MRIESLILENFRGYKGRTEIQFKSFNVIVGRNDIGKSTILEAIDIFINGKDAVSKYSKEDLSVGGANECMIGLVLVDLPERLVVDSSAETTLADEYLLNEDGKLEVYKIFGATSVKRIDLIAQTPTNNELKDLLELKIDKLKERAEGLSISEDNYNASVSSSIRSAIRNHLSGSLTLEKKAITILKSTDKGASTGKEIWNQLETYLPVFSLFQSDRKNEEKDSEVQSPMKKVIQQALKDEGLQDELNRIRAEVERATTEVANRTIEKLKEMNEEIADSLTPEFGNPKWDSAFSFNLFSDNNIPLNKRGSGVRRLILLNFFRAEAEKTRRENNVPHIIYALEEPETSQHPKHQQMLLDSFKIISEDPKSQVILTTHSPGIAKAVDENSLIFIKQGETGIEIPELSDDIWRTIADELGVLPTIELEDATKVKLAICVEGKNDINFLKGINQNIPELKEIIDLETSDSIIFFPMGGSSLQFWVNNDYLQRLKLNQLHLYDSDIGSEKAHQYQRYVTIINDKGAGHKAMETSMREMENLFSESQVNSIYGVTIPGEITWTEVDVPELIAQHNHQISESTKLWDDVSKEDRKKKTGRIKNQLCETHVSQISKSSLEEVVHWDEVKGWFESIVELIS